MQAPPPSPPRPPVGLLTPDRLYVWDGVGWTPTWGAGAWPPQGKRPRPTKRDWLGRIAWLSAVFVAANIGTALLTGNAHPSVALIASLAAAIVPLGLMGGWIRGRASWIEILVLAGLGAFTYVEFMFVGLSDDPVSCPGAADPASSCDIGFGIGGMIGAAMVYLPLLGSLALGKLARTRLFGRR